MNYCKALTLAAGLSMIFASGASAHSDHDGVELGAVGGLIGTQSNANPQKFAEPQLALARAVEALAATVGRPLDAVPKVREAGLSDELASRLAAILQAMATCQLASDAALASTSPAAIVAAAQGNGSLDPANFAGITACAPALWRAVGDLELHLTSDDFSTAAAAAEASLDLWPVLRLELGDAANVYVHDYMLQVDLAGDDVYRNNAGGNAMDFLRGPAAPAPNIGPARGCQTALNGFQAGDCQIGQAVLLDVAGNDVYGVFEDPDQDGLCTLDPVIRRTSTIGSGLVGVGILRDVEGDDQYNGKSAAMGAGHVFGIGILSEGGGNDRYLAVRNSQGFALLGGFGLLHEEGGDDSYDWYMPGQIDPEEEVENETPRAGGVVDDVGLCDRIPRFVQGIGNVGQAQGVLIDEAGNDSYRGATSETYGSSIAGGVETGSQGYGAQGGTGFFFDRGGDDVYEGVPGRANDTTVGDGSQSDGYGYFADDANGRLVVNPSQLPGAPGGDLGPVVVPDPEAIASSVIPVGFAFVPQVLTIPVGGTVVWDNSLPIGTVGHTVTTAMDLASARAGAANDGGNVDDDPDTFDLLLPQGGVVAHTFTKAGTFDYFCRPHAGLGMVGRIVVSE